MIFYGGRQVAPGSSGPARKRSMWVETVAALASGGLDVVATMVLPTDYFPQRDRADLQRMFDIAKDKARGQ